MAAPKYKRVLLKLSGEAFCREGGHGLDIDEHNMATARANAQRNGVANVRFHAGPAETL